MRGAATPTRQRSPIGVAPVKDAGWMHAIFRQERAWSGREKRENKIHLERGRRWDGA